MVLDLLGKRGVLGFYVVTKQAMSLTREIHETPPHYLLGKVIYLLVYRCDDLYV